MFLTELLVFRARLTVVDEVFIHVFECLVAVYDYLALDVVPLLALGIVTVNPLLAI